MRKQNRLVLLVSLGSLLVGIVILIWKFGSQPPQVKDDGYYNGPMRNKRGDLVTGDGKVLEKAAPSSERTGSRVGD